MIDWNTVLLYALAVWAATEIPDRILVAYYGFEKARNIWRKWREQRDSRFD